MTGETSRKEKSWKDKVVHEFAVYWGNVLYLSLVFAAFTQYRRLVLAAHDITGTAKRGKRKDEYAAKCNRALNRMHGPKNA